MTCCTKFDDICFNNPTRCPIFTSDIVLMVSLVFFCKIFSFHNASPTPGHIVRQVYPSNHELFQIVSFPMKKKDLSVLKEEDNKYCLALQIPKRFIDIERQFYKVQCYLLT